ncbi:MAG: hypothetical protein IH599_02585, partial [Bacteroidales bacterium]|nr:hypothetical protein [Bacteroidales bacterium]
PNPVNGITVIEAFIPLRGRYTIRISGMDGRLVYEQLLDLYQGFHAFQLKPGSKGMLSFSISSEQNEAAGITLINDPRARPGRCELNYVGMIGTPIQEKAISKLSGFAYAPGDKLLIIGYSDSLQSGVWGEPDSSTHFSLQFATNIPCPGEPSLTYGGQLYHTIQVFSQCWMKENLNYGTMLVSPQAQTNNLVVEKYCMGDVVQYCDSFFGGLYTWNEMMGYVYDEGGQGICPDGWHIPGEIDWQILEGSVDSDHGITDPVWAANGWRGSDAGGTLKQTGNALWEPPNTGATDAFGFCLVPAGYYVQNAFWGPGYKAYLWSSAVPSKYYRNMDWNRSDIQRSTGGSNGAFSVRCLRDQ